MPAELIHTKVHPFCFQSAPDFHCSQRRSPDTPASVPPELQCFSPQTWLHAHKDLHSHNTDMDFLLHQAAKNHPSNQDAQSFAQAFCAHLPLQEHTILPDSLHSLLVSSPPRQCHMPSDKSAVQLSKSSSHHIDLQIQFLC